MALTFFVKCSESKVTSRSDYRGEAAGEVTEIMGLDIYNVETLLEVGEIENSTRNMTILKGIGECKNRRGKDEKEIKKRRE